MGEVAQGRRGAVHGELLRLRVDDHLDPWQRASDGAVPHVGRIRDPAHREGTARFGRSVSDGDRAADDGLERRGQRGCHGPPADAGEQELRECRCGRPAQGAQHQLREQRCERHVGHTGACECCEHGLGIGSRRHDQRLAGEQRLERDGQPGHGRERERCCVPKPERGRAGRGE